jgi:hypothetical protein
MHPAPIPEINSTALPVTLRFVKIRWKKVKQRKQCT